MLDHFPHLPDWLYEAVAPLNRWLHIVCTTLIVGGTLFYEFVIPKAIMDLKEETQLSVLGRVRWFFRQIVIFSSVILIITGSLSILWQLQLYRGVFHAVQPWVFFHISLGVLSLLIAFVMMGRRRSSRHPLTWLRVNFVVLLIVMFLAAVSRHVRLSIRENMDRYHIPIGDSNTAAEIK